MCEVTSNILSFTFSAVMTNIVFSSDYTSDKSKLNQAIVENQGEKQFLSLFHTTWGYTGLNVKLPLDMSKFDLKVQVFYFDRISNRWTQTTKPYQSIGKKKKWNTFFCFNSGKIIMSGLVLKTMKEDFDYVTNFLQTEKQKIRETIQS